MEKKFIKYTLVTIFTIFRNNLFSSEDILHSYFKGISGNFFRGTGIQPFFCILPFRNEEGEKCVNFVINLKYKKDKKKLMENIKENNSDLLESYESYKSSYKISKGFEEIFKLTIFEEMKEKEKANRKNKFLEWLIATITVISLFCTFLKYKQNYNPIINNEILNSIIRYALKYTEPTSIFLLFLLNIFFRNHDTDTATIKYLFDPKDLKSALNLETEGIARNQALISINSKENGETDVSFNIGKVFNEYGVLIFREGESDTNDLKEVLKENLKLGNYCLRPPTSTQSQS